MKKANKLVIVLCAVFLVAGSDLVAAACTRSDAKGTWQVQGIIWDKAGVDATVSLKCKLKVGSKGGISSSKSTCSIFGEGTIDVTGGNIVVARNCAVLGNVKTIEGTVKFRTGQMDRSKNSFAVLAVDPIETNYEIYLDAIRQ